MYGWNQGKLVESLAVPQAAKAIGDANDFDVDLYRFAAAKEPRTPRTVRFGVTQTSIVLPTTASVDDQYNALAERHEQMVEAAAAAGCNVLCFQEAWYMCFAFCTREKIPWSAFAQCAETGASTKLLQRLAAKHNMVIVSPILERDRAHGDTIWNTAVVIGNNGNV